MIARPCVLSSAPLVLSCLGVPASLPWAGGRSGLRLSFMAKGSPFPRSPMRRGPEAEGAAGRPRPPLPAPGAPGCRRMRFVVSSVF